MYFKAIDTTLIMMKNAKRLDRNYRYVKYTVYRGVCSRGGMGMGFILFMAKLLKTEY